jgi:hypothetical protein
VVQFVFILFAEHIPQVMWKSGPWAFDEGGVIDITEKIQPSFISYYLIYIRCFGNISKNSNVETFGVCG